MPLRAGGSGKKTRRASLPDQLQRNGSDRDRDLDQEWRARGVAGIEGFEREVSRRALYRDIEVVGDRRLTAGWDILRAGVFHLHLIRPAEEYLALRRHAALPQFFSREVLEC